MRVLLMRVLLHASFNPGTIKPLKKPGAIGPGIPEPWNLETLILNKSWNLGNLQTWDLGASFQLCPATLEPWREARIPASQFQPDIAVFHSLPQMKN